MRKTPIAIWHNPTTAPALYNSCIGCLLLLRDLSLITREICQFVVPVGVVWLERIITIHRSPYY